MRIFLVGLLAACGPDGNVKIEDTQNSDDIADTSSGNAPDDSDTDVDPLADADQDGYPADVDCDDTDPSIHPEAEEICDEKDNDCNDLVDDNPSITPTWFADTDQDGFGNALAMVQTCYQPNGYVADMTDCNDADPASYPGAVEVWYDGADQDCDGILTVDDCNDADATMPTNDVDCDGVFTADDCNDADPNLLALANDADCDGHVSAADCDDANPSSTILASKTVIGSWKSASSTADSLISLALRSSFSSSTAAPE